MEIDGCHDVAPGGEEAVVPAEVPGVEPGALGAAMDQVGDRVLLGRVEPGRFDQVAEDAVALGSDEAERQRRFLIDARQGERVGLGQLPDRFAGEADQEELRWLGGRLAEEHHAVAGRGELGIAVDAAGHEQSPLAGGDGNPVEVLPTAFLDHGHHGARIGGPGQALDAPVPVRRDRLSFAGGPIVEDNLLAIGLEAGGRHRQIGDPPGVGRVTRAVIVAGGVGHRDHPGPIGADQEDLVVGAGGDDRVRVVHDRHLGT